MLGQQAAADITAFRAGDGAFPVPPPPPFIGGTEPGDWRPTGPAFLPMAAKWAGDVRPFTLTGPSQFLAPRPPALTSGLYTRDYNQVKDVGALVNSSRTAEQTELAHFWNLNYPGVWNQALRNIAAAKLTDIGEIARLFALANMAMADAMITAWNSKNHYVLWRPSTAIQEGDNDGNRHTAGDPAWRPLIPDPPYPDYTSGANNVTGSVTRMLRLFFQTNELTFPVTTTNAVAVQKTRTYSHITHAAAEVVDARVYQGIHFLFADAEGRHQGESVAKWAYKNFLRPVNANGADEQDK